MSPLSLRRHRAERLLREGFEGLRERVLASVRGRLRANGASLDQDDLEACYATAWQGLYAAVLEGQEIANPTGWLVLVTFRRAIEEQRDRARVRCGSELTLVGSGGLESARSSEPYGRAAAMTETAKPAEADFAAELDDRLRLRQLFEGLRGRLDGREREAATLCYLQGLSRSEAAARMGVSEARMRKLMEGRGPGRPGVAGKVGALVASIRDGEWCEEQGSLMRALAYGILDPEGERYQLALMHHGQCPACRAYVVSLRGLAAALPPVLLPWGVAAAALVRAGEGLHAGAAAGGAGSGAIGNGGVGGTGSAAGAGAVSASGAAGAGGVAGGGWLVGAGPLGAKLAVGCLLALGVGAGCVALDVGEPAHAYRHGHDHIARAGASARAADSAQLDGLAPSIGDRSASDASVNDSSATLTPSARASREFGPQALSSGGSALARVAGGRVTVASSASSRSRSAGSSSGEAAGGKASASREGGGEAAPAAPSSSSGGSAAAEREFSPG
jgi:DNA-directed RNA polymerase specialized sigma24 family protein